MKISKTNTNTRTHTRKLKTNGTRENNNGRRNTKRAKLSYEEIKNLRRREDKTKKWKKRTKNENWYRPVAPGAVDGLPALLRARTLSETVTKNVLNPILKRIGDSAKEVTRLT